MIVEWTNIESYKVCRCKLQCSRGGPWGLCREGYHVSHFSIKHASISKDPSTFVHPMPHAIPCLFRLHGCMAAGMLSEPPAGSLGHCEVTRIALAYSDLGKRIGKRSAPALLQDLFVYVELDGDLDSLRVESPWKIKVCFVFSMNGFGKMFSYFFLDIAWWYYQYQRGKKV